MRIHYLFLLLALMLAKAAPLSAQITCNPSGNLWVYANYDGGILNINVDVNVPNLKIGVCTYEPVTINITGAFASNVTEVRYAGYVSTNNNHCPNSPSTTTITGVNPSITSVLFLPGATLSNPNGYGSIVCAYSCATTSNQGGCNTADQIKDYFQTSMSATLNSYYTQYGCWSSGAYNLSSGGNCCGTGQPCAVNANAGPDQSVCAGNSVQLSASSTGGGSTYSWSPATGLSNPSIANPLASPSQTTTYVLTVSDGGSCADTDTLTVTVNTAHVTAPSVTSACDSAVPFTLPAGSFPFGVWSGPGVAGNVFDPSSTGAGTFTLQYTAMDTNGCFGGDSTTITVHSLPVIVWGTMPHICPSDPPLLLNVASPPGGTYAGMGVSNGFFTPSSGGPQILQYYYTDSNGCMVYSSYSFLVSTPPFPSTISLGGVDSLYSSTPGDSTQWFLNGQYLLTNGPIIEAPQSGSYTVVVWANGCPSAPSAPFQLELAAIDIAGQRMELWPNPASERIHVNTGGVRLELELIDMQGKVLIPATLVEGQGSLDLRELPAGAYILRARNEAGSGSAKVVKR